jgi:3-deoxy-D-manno-octulosonate 8-phosphate phosphatase (KDO 8-P phosphatase)
MTRAKLDSTTTATLDATARAARIRLVVLDVDGVLTDGRLYLGPAGEALKAFNVRDGLGVKLLREAGIEVAILSGRASDIVATRARELGIERVMQGQGDKRVAWRQLLQDTGLRNEQCAFIGDDWPDIPVMNQAGFAATVADADPQVRLAAHWVAQACGGHGAVREWARFILRAQGQFDAALARHAWRDERDSGDA